MLIIFDLDDTLVDTSGCITPVKLEDALKRLVQEGLDIPDFSEALNLLKRLDLAADSAKFALSEFLEIHSADPALLPIGIQEIYDNISFDFPLNPLKDANEVLNDLSFSHQLAIVTIGKTPQQLTKLKKAGIDSGIFSKIIVAEAGNKKVHYQALADELGYAPTEIVVCGDRISIDLAPARELGYKTVQMRWGRGLNSKGQSSDVDYKISSLLELKDIIAHLITISSF
ncbi:MAG: HAD family hydrolase [Parachlamydiales bacterium]|nr:HAD family hydrolase [Verrucomicrobiota bacterium]MBX3718905.1 HAD family hydrolase [Candidatus Acheromyda pituitae]